MPKNLSTADRIARLMIGAVIIWLGFTYRSWWSLIGMIPVATGLIGWCPFYKLFHICTCKKLKEEAKS